MMDATPKRSQLVLVNSEGQPVGARTAFEAPGAKLARLPAWLASRLAIAGCSEMEIATLTRHSLRDVGAILDAHHLNRDHGAGRKCRPKARKRNKISQLSSQLVCVVLREFDGIV